MQLRYGILSTSSIAPRFIAGVRAAGAGQILAVSSRTEEKARLFAAGQDIPVYYGSHDALLDDPNINIVYISTVNALHYTWAKAALLKGKHVVCEKPCTTDPAQTRELFSLAKEKGLFFMEAQKMLFLPTIREITRLLEEGALGKVCQIQLQHSFPASYNDWMLDESLGGGPLLSSGIYATELICALFGDITHIQGVRSATGSGLEWQYILCGETRQGVLFSIHNSTGGILDNTCRICTDKGFLEIPQYWKARSAAFFTPEKAWEISHPCDHELMYEAKHIEDCIQKGLLTSPVVTPQLTQAGIRALCAVKAQWGSKE